MLCAGIALSSAEAAEIRDISSRDFITQVHDGEKSKVLFIFTSWCRYCKEAFAPLFASFGLIDGGEEYSAERVASVTKKYELLIVSADTNRELLKDLVAFGLSEVDVPIYHINQGSIEDIMRSFDMMQIRSVPHLLVMDKMNGVFKKVYDGPTNAGEVRRMF